MRRWQWLAVLLVSGIGCARWTSALPDDPAVLRPPGRVHPDDFAGVSEPASPEPDQPPELASAAPAPAPVGTVEEPAQPETALAEQPAPVAPVAPDDSVLRTSAPAPDADELAALIANPGKRAVEVAAQVGDTYISTREVKRALSERVRGNEAWAQLSADEKRQIVRDVLEYLVNRALVVQAARAQLSKPKQWETLKERIEDLWQNNELPNFLKRYRVQNEVELARKLEESGDSLVDVKQSFQLDQISKMYTWERVHNKISVPEMQELYPYYRANIAKYQRPAEIRWREIFLSVDAEHDRVKAQAEAVEARRRVLGGESFDAVARSVSRGAKAAEGGAWSLAPGSFHSKAVNEAIDTLPIGQVSEVLDDPKGFFVVVVEARRPAGPIPFEEAQKSIREALQQQQYEKAIDEFLADVRRRTVVRSPMLEEASRR